jgi:multicomponent Na+:H+ antiporter subunit D
VTLAPAWAGIKRGLLGQFSSLVALLFRYHGPSGALAKTWPTGSMALWVAVLLAVFVMAYYL